MMISLTQDLKRLEDLGNKGDALNGLAAHYFNDCGLLLKRFRELQETVKMLENDNDQLTKESNEKKKMIRFNGVYDIKQLEGIINSHEEWEEYYE